MNETTSLFALLQTVALEVFNEEISADDFDLHDFIYASKKLESGCTYADVIAEFYGECSCS
jgi:hypothetical protein